MKGLCKDCDYWDQSCTAAGEIRGICRRYAPKLIVACCGIGETPEYSENWACTSENEWCGEFKPKESEDSQNE